jgi:hypothetical protein
MQWVKDILVILMNQILIEKIFLDEKTINFRICPRWVPWLSIIPPCRNVDHFDYCFWCLLA